METGGTRVLSRQAPASRSRSRRPARFPITARFTLAWLVQWSYADSVTSRPDDRAVAPPRRPPRVVEVWRTRRVREFRGELFVHFDAEAWPLLREHVAVPDLRTADEDFPGLWREAAAFVHAEVVA